MKSVEIKREEALERQQEHDKLTAAQKITKLDLRFGGGKGAKKERAKLAIQYEKEKQEVGKQLVAELKKDKKHYQKPKKS